MHHLETVTGSLPNCSASICLYAPFPLILPLFYLVFVFLFLSPLDDILNLNANLVHICGPNKFDNMFLSIRQ